MQFDRMKAAGVPAHGPGPAGAGGLYPAPEEGEVLLNHLPLLAQFGFACEAFGGGALVVRRSLTT
ncbi:MAG: hypothetical protein ACLR1T_10990 [Evtepia gabavorous]